MLRFLIPQADGQFARLFDLNIRVNAELNGELNGELNAEQNTGLNAEKWTFKAQFYDFSCVSHLFFVPLQPQRCLERLQNGAIERKHFGKQ